MQCDVDTAIDFLCAFAPTGHWVITAIKELDDNGKDVKTQSFGVTTKIACRAFIEAKQSQQYNIYFTVNQVRAPLSKKCTKADIAWLNWLQVDVDPIKGRPLAEEQARILGVLMNFKPKPTVIIFSGGGYQGFWRLNLPSAVDGNIELLESYSRGLAQQLGGDACFNIDRIMRLPGTFNFPDEKKRAAGREIVLAKLIEADWDCSYALEQFTPASVEDATVDDEPQQEFQRAPLPEWVERVILHGHDPDGEKDWKGDRSKAVFAVVCEMVRCGRTDDEIERVILSKQNGISEHVLEQNNFKGYAAKQIKNARKKVATDFKRDDKKRPTGNLSNIRLALNRLDVDLSHDDFSDRIFIEGPQNKQRRVIRDEDAVRIRHLIEDMYGIRVGPERMHDILVDEAQNKCYHPVKDYLDGLRWDRKERIGSWLVDYMGAEDSKFVRAVSAIVLIAAVRRIREPGCKFDEMLILESPIQGLEKSSSLAALAVRNTWFTDSLGLDSDGKETIEQLQGKWIVEASELKGMSVGKVEHLKNFLSKTFDRGRPAYGRMVVEAPRQCIFIGTTNSTSYLVDASGNRRFWPVRVNQIKLEELARDRDQLWAEAVVRETEKKPIRLPDELWQAAANEQEERLSEHPWEAFLEETFENLCVTQGCFLVRDAVKLIDMPVGQWRRDHSTVLCEVMQRLGWHRKTIRFGDEVNKYYSKGDDKHLILVSRNYPRLSYADEKDEKVRRENVAKRRSNYDDGGI